MNGPRTRRIVRRASTLAAATLAVTASASAAPAALALTASASAAPTLLPKQTLPLDSGHSAHGVQVGMDAKGDALTLFNITQTGASDVQTVETDDRFAARIFGNFTDMSQGPIDGDANATFDGRLAVDPAGDASAAWSYRPDPAGNPAARAIRLRTRPAGGDWGAPIDVSAAGAPADEQAVFPSVALDASGMPTAAWIDAQAGTVRAATQSPNGSWPASQILNPTGPEGSGPTAAANARGDRVVAWHGRRATPGDEVVEVNTAGAGASKFSSPKTLGNLSGTTTVTDPAAAVSATGTATVLWGEGVPTGSVSATDIAVGGNPSPTVNVSAMDAVQNDRPPAFAMDARGDAVAVWATAGAIRAAFRPAGQPWGLPQTVALAQGTLALSSPISAAIDPSGNVIAAWSIAAQATTVQIASHRAGGNWNVVGLASDATNPVPRVAMDAAGDGIVAWSPPAGAANASHSVETAGFDGAGPQLNGLSIATSAVAGAPTAFAVSPLDVWSHVASTAWTFGDGGSSVGTSVQHTYGAPGRYTVTVSSADALGNPTSASGIVNVSPAPPPLAATGAVQRLGQTSATISATVNAHGQAGTYRFDWGRTTAYGSHAPQPDAATGSSLANRVVATTLTHLRPGTTYHYRVTTSYCGGCSFGTSVGTDGTFRTLALPQLPGTMSWQFAFGRSTSSVLSMVTHVPRGADRLLVTCAAHGCPSGRWSVPTTASKRRCHHRRCERVTRRLTAVDVSPRLHGHALAPAGHITVEVLKRRYTGIVFQFTIRRSQLPEFSKRCLVTGARTPVVC